MSVMAATVNPYPLVLYQLVNFCAVPRTNFIAATITAPDGSFATSSFAASIVSTAIGS